MPVAIINIANAAITVNMPKLSCAVPVCGSTLADGGGINEGCPPAPGAGPVSGNTSDTGVELIGVCVASMTGAVVTVACGEPTLVAVSVAVCVATDCVAMAVAVFVGCPPPVMGVLVAVAITTGVLVAPAPAPVVGLAGDVGLGTIVCTGTVVGVLVLVF